MASLPRSARLSVEELLKAVEHLSPSEKREFQWRLAARQAGNGAGSSEEAALIRATRARLPAAAESRLKKLIAKSERGRLTPKELTAYQALAQRARQVDAARIQALGELARRWGKSVRAVKAAVGWEGAPDEA